MAKIEIWECQCGKKIEEGKDFIWDFKCFNLECGEVYCVNCGKKENIGTSNCNFCGGSFDIHSKECYQKNWEEKQETVIKPLADKHLEVCDKTAKCDKCHKKFMYKESWSQTSKGNNYHKSCWEELQRERQQNQNNNRGNDDNCREREREREQNSSNPQNQTELERKRKQLEDLQKKEKPLTNFLPLDTQISILEREIKGLENKPTKFKEEERVLEEKKKELERLLKEKCKVSCKKCGKDNVFIIRNIWVVEDGLCFECWKSFMLLELQKIRERIGLEKVRVEWKNNIKTQIKENLRNIRNGEQYQTGLTEEEKRESERMEEEFIQAVENELYPERKNQGGNKTGWIIGGGIIVVIIGSVVYYFFYKKRKR